MKFDEVRLSEMGKIKRLLQQAKKSFYFVCFIMDQSMYNHEWTK